MVIISLNVSIERTEISLIRRSIRRPSSSFHSNCIPLSRSEIDYLNLNSVIKTKIKQNAMKFSCDDGQTKMKDEQNWILNLSSGGNFSIMKHWKYSSLPPLRVPFFLPTWIMTPRPLVAWREVKYDQNKIDSRIFTAFANPRERIASSEFKTQNSANEI